MAHFSEIKISETASDYVDLDKVYRVRSYRKPMESGGTLVEVYFDGMATPVIFSKEQAEVFLGKFHPWAEIDTK